MAGDIITARSARLELGDTQFDVLLALGRHHSDDDGQAYWLEEEWDELVGLIHFEVGGAAGCDDPTTPE